MRNTVLDVAAARKEPAIKWPNQKRFAFTIFDDTDFSTLENIRPTYHLLKELGLRTTKSVWPLQNSSPNSGATCADPQYTDFVRELQRAGFEIGMHGASAQTSDRHTTALALEQFRGLFGDYPATLAQHGNCAENLYWGDGRVGGVRRHLYRVAHCFSTTRYEGVREHSALFWGDLCKAKVKFVRNFVFRDINTLKMCPEMPYHDPERPNVNFWFASSNGCDPRTFAQLLSEASCDRLEEEGGACIVYSHLYNFSKNGRVLPGIRVALERIAEKKGWFVPVGTLLDFLLSQKQEHVLSDIQRKRLEWQWLGDVVIAHLSQFANRSAMMTTDDSLQPASSCID